MTMILNAVMFLGTVALLVAAAQMVGGTVRNLMVRHYVRKASR